MEEVTRLTTNIRRMTEVRLKNLYALVRQSIVSRYWNAPETTILLSRGRATKRISDEGLI